MYIYIDVGHGKTKEDSGASAYSAPTLYYENERNLRIAKKTKEILESAGHTVKLSRTANENTGAIVGAYNRADSNLINSAKNVDKEAFDFMISIHCNDANNTKAKGAVLISKTDELSKKLCNALNTAFKGYTKIGVNYIKTDDSYKNYGILRLHGKSGVLVECGFMSNAVDLHEILCNYNTIGETIGNALLTVIGKIQPVNKYDINGDGKVDINDVAELVDKVRGDK